MTPQAPTYRWNTSAAAEAFDQAAEFIHPRYLAVQDQILDRLPFATNEPFVFVDLGAGSGRLVERILDRYANALGVLVDQSEPFLGIAERRLQQFGDRAVLIQSRLQDDWESKLPATPNAIVSMSAIHHLDSAEKQSLYARCFEILAPGGVFLNGDEFRPAEDVDYLTLLQWWAAQKDIAEKNGQIPDSFRPVFEAWYDRNIRRFGEPKKSGDDCLETTSTQVGYLRSIGFTQVEAPWTDKLWGILAGRKP